MSDTVSGGAAVEAESRMEACLDYIMHHRVGLAAEIVKSTANGRGLSHKRERVLRSSIDYIEQRL